MRVYIRNRYHRIRKEVVTKLGGQCRQCGSEENLEVDHIDRTLKVESIGKLWTYKKERLDEELKKCQLLCKECHKNKTLNDLGKNKAIGNHGTISTHRYCKCVLCKKAHNDYCAEWKIKKKLKKT